MHFTDWVRKDGYYELKASIELGTYPMLRLITTPSPNGKWNAKVKDYGTKKVLASTTNSGDLNAAKADAVRLAKAVIRATSDRITFADYKGRVMIGE